jgi:hypothetical protein
LENQQQIHPPPAAPLTANSADEYKLRLLCRVSRLFSCHMISSVATRMIVVFSLMMSVAFATLPSAGGTCGSEVVCHEKCCNDMACCLTKNKSPQPAQQIPGQKTGGQLAEAILSTPVGLPFVPQPVKRPFAIQRENQRGHLPDPLAVGCIRLI